MNTHFPLTLSTKLRAATTACLVCLLLVGCRTKTVEPAKTTELAQPKLDLVYPLPEGGADALLDFINTMAAREPAGETDEDRTKDIGNMMASRIAAAEKLLSLPEGDQFAALTCRTKLESLRVLQMIGQPGADTNFTNYANEIAASEDEEVASVGQIGLFQSLIDETMNRQSDGQKALASYRQLLESVGKTEAVFFAGQEASMMLRQAGNADAAGELLALLSESFSDHENEQIAGEAKSAAKEKKLLAFDSKFRELMEGSDVGSDLAAMAHEILSVGTIDPTALGMVMQAAQQLEYSGHVEAAQALYSKADSATKDTDFAQQISEDLETAKTRLGLLGEPFEVTGQVVGGEEFDWSNYDGKVVLVDFWATWCGPCLREVPSMKKNYARFKDQGFEVVSINLDDELETVENFLKKQPLPWATVVGEDESELGFDNPNAVRCGVKAIPFLVLVDQDGKVAALHVRDKLLEEKLIELLGEPEEEVLEITDPGDK